MMLIIIVGIIGLGVGLVAGIALTKRPVKTEIETWLVSHIPRFSLANSSEQRESLTKQEWEAYERMSRNPDFRLILESLVEDHVWEPDWLDPNREPGSLSETQAVHKDGRKAVVMQILGAIKAVQIDQRRTATDV